VKRHLLIIALGVSIALSVGFLLYTLVGGSPRTRNMDRASRHIDVVQPLLDREDRFRLIQLHVYDGLGGSMSVNGEVSSAADLEALHALVAATHPPVSIYWRVRVATTQPGGLSPGTWPGRTNQ
jgi:hypothetical protein